MPILSEEVRQLNFRIERLERLVTKQLARHSQYPIIGSGVEIVEFTILSVDEAALTALVQIDWRPCGKTSSTGEDSNEQLTVHDPGGCKLNEPEEDLVGRTGAAVYEQSDYTGVCQWNVWSICCPDCT